MFDKVKNTINKSLDGFLHTIDSFYGIHKVSPLLFSAIKEFLLRNGKRIRPTLFVIGYLGYTKHIAKNLYTSALAIELLHDFMLVHDDIIDKSPLRRGKPSMHEIFNRYLKRYKNVKFSGQDLALITGDIMYALAIKAFLSINESMQRKEKALVRFIEAAIYTGSGEFIELINGLKDISRITKDDIYKIYDYKTAYYTFSTPLASGAMLAGANKKQAAMLFKYGTYLGRAFQIKDDMIGMFEKESSIGKSTLSDLQEAKKTLLIWYAYHKGNRTQKKEIKKIFVKQTVSTKDLLRIRTIVIETGALSCAKKEILFLKSKAQKIIASSHMKKYYRDKLHAYPNTFLIV